MIRGSEAARQMLDEFGLDSVIDEDLCDLVYARGLVFQEVPLSGCEGRIVYSPSGQTAMVTVNSNTRYRPRKRFSIAHELGHYELKHNKIHCENEGTLDCYRKGHQEAEANEFASELLMPAALFDKAVQGRRFSPELVEEVAELFGTSVSSVVYRYLMSGPVPVAAVYSYCGKVVWWRKSQEMRRRMIDWTGREVPHNSVSEEWFQDHTVYASNDIQDVDLNVWFDLGMRRTYTHTSSKRFGMEQMGIRGWDSWDETEEDTSTGESMCHEHCFVSRDFGSALAVIWED